MNRRTFLSSLVVVALAGCSTVSASEQFRQFESKIEESSIDVRQMGEEDRRWVLEYYPVTGSREEVLGEVGVIARAYADAVPAESQDGQHRQLDVILYRADDSRSGSLSIGADMARGFRSGDVSEDEYYRHVMLSARIG